ncbi:MAG: hypothetical protein IPH34_02320 [Chitinophagaceae bacterium]|nr:hypothetical protein [Chitinophagaceae bacterium]MBK8605602.1 hypothetical protein [Chitinophagaceae bacterium]MBP6478548.1 hypothetical protein [Chitinophagaceae bacterium]MBP7314212.1 hypothetical protein [Chitinophagaceae bacterium]HRA12054.1 hypothetical protein [Chitinophagaceae bacterium]
MNNVIRHTIIVGLTLLINVTIAFEVNGQSEDIDCNLDTISKEKFTSLSVFLERPFIKTSLEKLNIKNGIVYLTNQSYGSYLFGIVLYLTNRQEIVDVYKIKINVTNKTFETSLLKKTKLRKYRNALVDFTCINYYYGFFRPHHHPDLDLIFTIEEEQMIGGFVSNSLLLPEANKGKYYTLISKIMEISKNKW